MKADPRALDVLGDPTRRAIVERLRRGPSPVGRLAEGMPVSRPAVSQHLSVLRTAGLVSEHREGTRRIYRLEADGIEQLLRWVEAVAADARLGGPATGAAKPEPAVGAPVQGAEARTPQPTAPKDGGKKKHGKKRAGRK